MTTAFPLVTALYAALLGLLGAVLTARVIINRVRGRVDAGDGGIAALAQALRAHGNFVEQAPLALLLLVVAEGIGVRPLVLNILGVALVAARLASAIALSRSLGQSPLRQFGGGFAVLILAATSIAILLALAGVR
jgi:uncharacterized membrane protein YecN with MAPEG domain